MAVTSGEGRRVKCLHKCLNLSAPRLTNYHPEVVQTRFQANSFQGQSRSRRPPLCPAGGSSRVTEERGTDGAGH